MAAQREVFIKITALDGTTKTVNAIAASLNKLSRDAGTVSLGDAGIDKRVSATENALRKAQKVIDDLNAKIKKLGDENRRQADEEQATARRLADFRSRMTAQRIKEEQRASADYLRRQRQYERDEEASVRRLADFRSRMTAQRIKEEQQAAKQIKSITNDAQSSFRGVFSGSFLGGLAGGLVSEISRAFGTISNELGKSLEAGQSFERLTTSLNVLTGSAEVTRAKLAELRELAKTTAGLDFRGAAEGQRNLQAVGFAADQATEFMKGLARVRILSGGTKEDFKAVLYNLAQIRANGKLTGDELKESVMRLPFLARVIQDTFGTLNSKVINETTKTSDEFFKRFLEGLEKVPAASGGATLAFEQLSEATDRFYTATGSIILQNPEFLALLQNITGEIDAQAQAYENLESRQARTMASFITGFAKVGHEARIFVGFLNAAFVEVGRIVGFAGLTIYRGIRDLFSTVGELANTLILEPTNKIIDTMNGIFAGIKQIPPELLGAFGAAVQGIPTVPRAQLIPVEDRNQIRREQSISRDLFLKDFGSQFGKAATEADNLTDSFRRLTEENKKLLKEQQNFRGKGAPPFSPSGRGNEDGGGTGGKAPKLSEAERATENVLKQMRELAREQGFTPGSGFRGGKQINAGSAHGDFRALDVSVAANSRKTIDDWTRYVIAGLEKGFRAIDERVVGFHKGIKSTGPNVHLEANKTGKPSLFLPQRFYSVPVEFLKELDEKRRGRTGTGVTTDRDLEQFRERQFKELRQQGEGTSVASRALALAKAGFIPDEKLAAEIARTVNERIEKLFVKGLIEAKDLPQEATAQSVREGFAATIAKRQQAPVFVNEQNTRERVSTLTVSDNIQRQLTAQEEYAKSVREGLNFREQENELFFKQDAIVQQLLRDLRLETEQRQQQIDLLDAQIGLQVTLAQSADKQFVSNRRALDAVREQNDLLREQSELSDRIANFGANSGLRVENALLQDLLELRRHEEDAIIRINRAQLDLNSSLQISNNQIRAGVLEHLAEVTNINDSIVSGINQSFDAMTDLASDALDKLNAKAKGTLSVLIEPLKAFQRNALADFARPLLDKIFPGMGALANQTSNPIAKPIVTEQQQTNKKLDTLIAIASASSGVQVPGAVLSGVIPTSGGNSGGGLLGMLGSIFGIGNRSRTGGTPPFVPQQFTGGASLGLPFANFTTGAGNLSAAQIFGDAGGRLGNRQGGFLSSIFGRNPFGQTGKSGLGQGTFNGLGYLGMGLSTVGGLIGGRVGGALSAGGSGLSAGLMAAGAFGGPIGIAVGAGVGLLSAIFGGVFGDPKRKADKKQLPDFQKAFADALQQLRDLAANKNAILANPDGVLAQAKELVKQIESGLGFSWQSKKYTKEAASITKAKTIEAKAILKSLEAFANKARSATNRRINPEFKDGGMVSKFLQNAFSGLVPGTYDRKDDKLIRVTGHEVVLTPDVWKPIIPYLRERKVPGFANGGAVSRVVPVSSQPHVVKSEYHNCTFTAESKRIDHYSDGRTETIALVKDAMRNGKIRQADFKG